MARGVAKQSLRNHTETILGLEDGSVYRQHYDQIHFQGQETKQIGDKTEVVDTDIRREALRLIHNIPNPSDAALSGTPISVTSGEGPSVPKTCQAADAWVPLQEPERDVAAPILLTSARDTPVPRFPTS